MILLEREHWEPITRTDGPPFPMICCPGCHEWIALSLHPISASGEVLGSVLCSRPHCTFHDYVHLVGWGQPCPT